MVCEASRIEFRPFWQQDEKLVSTHSRDVAAQWLGQCPGDAGQFYQDVVTGGMASAVVELLEMIDVDRNDHSIVAWLPGRENLIACTIPTAR